MNLIPWNGKGADTTQILCVGIKYIPSHITGIDESEFPDFNVDGRKLVFFYAVGVGQELNGKNKVER